MDYPQQLPLLVAEPLKLFSFLAESALPPDIGDKVHTAVSSCNVESSLHNLCVNKPPKNKLHLPMHTGKIGNHR